MDIFKANVGISKIYKINQDNFLMVTNRKKPYVQKNANNRDSYFAVCPECENPIQIIALFKNTDYSGKKPHGRHYIKTISELAEYNEEDYKNCSYSNPRWEKENNKRTLNSKISKMMLKLLKEQFDRVIYVLQKDIDIYISLNTARDILKSYLGNEGWLYRDSTLNNLPWKFGESGSAFRLHGRKIMKGSELYKALKEKCPEVNFVEKGESYVSIASKDGQYVDIVYFLCGHEKVVIDEELKETIQLWVRKGKAPNTQEVYTKTIEIKTAYFMNLINSKRDNENRNYKLLEIANELIPNINE